MEWVEITAKTIEEAKDQALDRLGVDERDAEFEVLEEPRTGIFGRAKGEARVRARVKPSTPRAKLERRDRKKERPERADRPARNGAGRAPKKDVVPSAEPAMAVDAISEEAPAASARSACGAESPRSDERRSNTDLADLDLDQQTEVVAEVLRGVVAALGDTAEVRTRRVDDDTAEVTIDGPSLGFLVGPRGRTLGALHEVSRSVVLRRGNTAPSARVHVDVAGYRQRRRDALAAFVAETAEKVRDTGKAHVLEPMGSMDRKTVHDTVAELVGVSSLSEGEDADRRVVIVPA